MEEKLEDKEEAWEEEGRGRREERTEVWISTVMQ